MKRTQLISKLLVSTLALTTVVSSISAKAQQTSKNVYSCINHKGIPTTVVDTKRGRIELIVWKSDYFKSSGWTPRKRCEAITSRFQKFSDNGKLRYVTTGKINNYKVICVGQPSPGSGYSCRKDGLLITLQANDNPNKVLRNLFSNAAKVGGTPVTRGDNNRPYALSINRILNQAPLMSAEENEQVNLDSTSSNTAETDLSKPEN